MKMKYSSRIDWWLAAIIVATLLYPLYVAIASDQYLVVLIVVIVLILLRIVYVVEGETLTVWMGFFRISKGNINDILAIYRTTSLLSAPALSIDRLAITFKDGKIVVVSPKDRQGFIAALQQINPEIVTDDSPEEKKEAVMDALSQSAGYSKSTHLWWLPSILMLVVSAVYNVVVYDTLPERIAIHFDLDGVANGFASRFGGIWGLWMMNVALVLLHFGLSKLPASMISGMADATEAERNKASQKMKKTLAIISFVLCLILFFCNYYIVQKN